MGGGSLVGVGHSSCIVEPHQAAGRGKAPAGRFVLDSVVLVWTEVVNMAASPWARTIGVYLP